MTKIELILLPEFRALLRVNSGLDEARAATKVQQRLIGIGLERACGRCGGCGNYSYCQSHGTTCFQCSGSGKVAQKLTRTLHAEACEAIAAGKLDAYFVRCTRVSAARAIRSKLSGFQSLDLRFAYADNRPDKSDAWTAFALNAEVTHRRLVDACSAAIFKLEANKTVQAAAESEAVLATFDAVVRNFRAVREAAAARPDFCAARVYNPQYWVEFFPRTYVVAEFSRTGHPSYGWTVKRTDYVVGALNVEDLLLCLCNQHASECRRCEIVTVLS